MRKFNLKKGFTLLEALVAISILMVAVSAPITIAQKGLASAVYSKDQMIASYLAQDAIEYVKNLRDQVVRNSEESDWAELWDGLSSCLIENDNDDGCKIDTIKGEVSSFANGEKLKKNTNGFYQYDDGVDTKFTRQIQITRNDLDAGESEVFDEALITVTVNWGEGNEVVVNTLIYNY
jgi:type II secretory pathway pseudopilin PulG